MSAGWKPFGRPSGIWIEKNDTLRDRFRVRRVPRKDTNNPGCKRGLRIGRVKTGKLDYCIPPHQVSDAKFPPPESIAVDSHGTIYTAAVQDKTVYQYVKNWMPRGSQSG